MIEAYQTVLKLIDAGLKEKNISISELKITKVVARILKEQTFLPFLYKVTAEEKFKTFYFLSALYSEEIDNLTSLVKNLFDANNIDHIFLKGTVIRKYYNDPYLRMLGDVDVYINEHDLKKATKILKNNGFKFLERCSHHLSFSYKNIEFELHFHLIEVTNPFYEYFSKPFSHSQRQDHNTYALDIEYHFVFIIVHYMKHLLDGGAGLRPLCDIYVLINKFNLDLVKIKNIFNQYKYTNFFNTILNMLDYVFSYHKYEYIKNEKTEELIEYTLKSGIHGFGKDNNKVKNKQIAQSNSKIKYLFKLWFIPVKSLFAFYPWTKSIILIPLGYLFRLFHLIFKRQDKFKELMSNKNNDNKMQELLIKTGVKYE